MKIKSGISGSVLKWIAVLSMAIDHMGAGFLESYVMNARGGSPIGAAFAQDWNRLLSVDHILRYIGRPAFPIFCFLLVQGFLHTSNVKKYAIRLGLFALISEVPFDLALHIRPVHWQNQNVFFTLLIGLLAIWFMQSRGDGLVVRTVGLLAGAGLAEVLHTDYGAFGVALIVVLYLFRNRKAAQCVLGAFCCAWEITAPLAFLPVWFYNGERGRQPRWFFYWFYPVHLLLYSMVGMFVLPALVL